MSSTAQMICPSCGMPADPGAAFCESCGAVLDGMSPVESRVSPVENAESRMSPVACRETPGGAEPDTRHATGDMPDARQATGDMPDARQATSDMPYARHATGDMPDAPLELIWDDARAFIVGQTGQFAFRLRARCSVAKAALSISVDGAFLPAVKFERIRAFETREGTIPFAPAAPGAVSVSIRLETVLETGAHETFCAERAPEHDVMSAERIDVRGAGSITINQQNNTGLARNDGLNLSALRGVSVDRWAEQRSVLGRRGGFHEIAVLPLSVRHETAMLRSRGRDVVFVAGSDLMTFGVSHRAAVRVSAFAGPASGIQDGPLSFVSGRHFSLRRDRASGSIVVCDGAPCAKSGDSSHAEWKRSTNGTTFDGETLSSSGFPLPPGSDHEISLAPYAVRGGALSLHIFAAGAPDFVKVTSSGESACSAVVVWGRVPLEEVLGPDGRGMAVSCVDGRLVFEGPGVRRSRLAFRCGGSLPGCPSWNVCPAP